MTRAARILVAAAALVLGGCSGIIDGSPWGHIESRVGGGPNPCDSRCSPTPAPAREPKLASVK